MYFVLLLYTAGHRGRRTRGPQRSRWIGDWKISRDSEGALIDIERDEQGFFVETEHVDKTTVHRSALCEGDEGKWERWRTRYVPQRRDAVSTTCHSA
jgi:hypothetical protein